LTSISPASTPQEAYLSLLPLISQHLEKEELSLFKASLALKEVFPKLQAGRSWYSNEFNSTESLRDCESWYQLGDHKSCDLSDIESLLTVADEGEDTYLQFPFDHIHSSSSNPALKTIILYSHPSSSSFSTFHSKISKLSDDSKAQYVLRWKPLSHGNGDSFYLSGWGAALDLKKTDYLTIDDRNLAKTDGEGMHHKPSVNETNEAPVIKPLTSEELSGLFPFHSCWLPLNIVHTDLGMRASYAIISSSSPLDTLETISQNLLTNLHKLPSKEEIPSEFEGEILWNQENVFQGGKSGFWLNGMQLGEKDIDSFG
jgi:UDP-glucose:glycoprotein glucosyltransferase